MSLDVCVRESLDALLSQNISPGTDLSVVDEIVLSYLINVLEDVGDEESFDVDEFIEVMTAYIPGFEQVDRGIVYSWLYNLASQLADKKSQNNSKDFNKASQDKGNAETLDTDLAHLKISTVKTNPQSHSSKRTFFNHDTTQSTSSDNQEKDNRLKLNSQNDLAMPSNLSQQVQSLQELFPVACSLQIMHCLSVAKGDMDQAAQLMLLKSDEEGLNEHLNSSENSGLVEVFTEIPDFQAQLHKPSAKRQDLAAVEKDQLKNELISRYSYVDVESDKRTHRPVVCAKDEKTLVRYRDNHVVTTKGERTYIEKPVESEEMKKTYVNLKPAEIQISLTYFWRSVIQKSKSLLWCLRQLYTVLFIPVINNL